MRTVNVVYFLVENLVLVYLNLTMKNSAKYIQALIT